MINQATGHNGSDLQINDYVAIVFDNGTRSTVLGRITSFETDSISGVRAIVDNKNGIRVARLTRTNVR